MAFRSQRFHELCSVCKAAAEAACPRCGVVLCDGHAHEPYGCCERCATDIYMQVSRAGHRALTTGGVLSVASAAVLYFLGPIVTPILTGVLLLGIAGGFGIVIWGGLISPRLADRRLRKELKRPRALPASDPAGGDGSASSGGARGEGAAPGGGER